MNETEIIEQLTQIIEIQAFMIRKLHGIIKQLNATTSIDDEVAFILEESDSITQTTGGGSSNACRSSRIP